jgi:Mn2+/Fe2+ NRAMP family transporter
MEFFRTIFLQKRLFAILAGLVVLFALSAAVKGLFVIAQVLFFVVLLVTLVETLMLFGKKKWHSWYQVNPGAALERR